MKIKLKSDILFEFPGIKKTLFKANSIHEVNRKQYKYSLDITGAQYETRELLGYWVGKEHAPDVKLKGNDKLLGALIETNVLLNECEILND